MADSWRDCEACRFRVRCLARVIKLEPFYLPECNQPRPPVIHRAHKVRSEQTKRSAALGAGPQI